MYYTIYKTTNKINGKIYIGQHQTDNLDDGYLGSGTLLKRAIVKYGEHSFSKEILFIFSSFDEMNNKEKELVNEEFIGRPDTYNIITGGGSSFGYGTVVVRYKDGSKFFRITRDEFICNRDLYATVRSGMMSVIFSDGSTGSIPVEDFDHLIHKSPSSGKRPVVFPDGTTASIPVEDFDPTIHSHPTQGRRTAVLPDGTTASIPVEAFDPTIHSHPSRGRRSVVFPDGSTGYIFVEDFDPTIHRSASQGKRSVVFSDGTTGSIPVEEFDPTIHSHPTQGRRTAVLPDGTTMLIPVEDFDPTIHKSPSTGRKSVYFPDGSTASIPIDEFDPTIHKSVFGGIIAEIDGVRQYVTKEEFDSKNLVGVHAGKVTARNKLTGELKHVPVDEFHANRDIYHHNTQGFTTGRHKITGEARRFATSEVDQYRDEYNFTTTGYTTVFDETLGKFTNIPKDQYDPLIHKKATATKLELYNKDNECIMKYWGTKRQFLSENGFPEGLWIAMLEDRVYRAHVPKYQHLDGYYFKRIDWKSQYNL